MSQESFHFSASFAFDPSVHRCRWSLADCSISQPLRRLPRLHFLLFFFMRGRAEAHALLLTSFYWRKARSTRGSFKWLLNSVRKQLCDLQPVLALRRLPLTEIPLTSLSDADVLVSTKATPNAAIKCTTLDAISSECKMRSKHSGIYWGNFGKKRENQMNKEWEQSSK